MERGSRGPCKHNISDGFRVLPRPLTYRSSQADAAWAQLRGEAEADVHALELVAHTLASALTVVRHDRAKRQKT